MSTPNLANPWAFPAPRGYPVTELIHSSVEERIHLVRDTTDITRLRAMADHPSTQLTVARYIARRIRRLEEGPRRVVRALPAPPLEEPARDEATSSPSGWEHCITPSL